MRKIEQEMLEAIEGGRDWQKDNTCVDFSQHAGNPYLSGTVYLHANPIAEIYPNGCVSAIPETLVQWPTPTTKSRLRALGVDLTQHKGKIYIDGEYVCHVD